ncbi:MAG: PAS domain S-box protein [Burkholderiales bacterium]|nr:PAS domain S-box protein [Burkholderiales bacterium]
MLPIVLVLLFVAVLLWLPWQAQKMEANERQEQLIADTLWVEQSLLFQLKRNEENLFSLAHEVLQKKETQTERDNLQARSKLLLSNSHEILSLQIWNAQQQLILSQSDTDTQSEITKDLQQGTQVAELIHDGNRINVAQCVKQSGAQDTILCRFPILQEKTSLGAFTVRYRLQTLLDEAVPWWFAQDNEISLQDSDEQTLAKRSAGGPGKHIYTHNRQIELPQLNLTLHTDSTKSAPKLLSNLLVVSVVLLSAGLLWSLIALWRDINRRLRAEGALRKEVAFRAAMENSLITGLRARDMEGRLTYINPSFCAMVGYPPEDIIGRLPPMPYWAPEAIAEYEQRFAQILTGTVQPEGFETIYQRANGERFPVLIYESPLVDEHGTQTGWMSSILDISELKRAQERSRQQEEKLHANARLATMGEMASMLAHELNQPLAAISSYTTGAINLLNEDPKDAALLPAVLDKVRQQAQRAGQVIRSVHEFVKKREVERAPLNIATLIHNIAPLIELQAQHAQVHVHYQVEPQLPEVLADKVLLEQVLLNLTRNAIDAMQDIAAECKQLQIHAHLSFTRTDQILIQIIDHGAGISDDIAAELFSPFFSTKPEGMGMGLNICRTAIEFHGGSLQHRANPEGGTIFEFSLPIQ